MGKLLKRKLLKIASNLQQMKIILKFSRLNNLISKVMQMI